MKVRDEDGADGIGIELQAMHPDERGGAAIEQDMAARGLEMEAGLHPSAGTEGVAAPQNGQSPRDPGRRRGDRCRNGRRRRRRVLLSATVVSAAPEGPEKIHFSHLLSRRARPDGPRAPLSGPAGAWPRSSPIRLGQADPRTARGHAMDDGFFGLCRARGSHCRLHFFP